MRRIGSLSHPDCNWGPRWRGGEARTTGNLAVSSLAHERSPLPPERYPFHTRAHPVPSGRGCREPRIKIVAAGGLRAVPRSQGKSVELFQREHPPRSGGPGLDHAASGERWSGPTSGGRFTTALFSSPRRWYSVERPLPGPMTRPNPRRRAPVPLRVPRRESGVLIDEDGLADPKPPKASFPPEALDTHGNRCSVSGAQLFCERLWRSLGENGVARTGGELPDRG